jgi:hypothetical protein
MTAATYKPRTQLADATPGGEVIRFPLRNSFAIWLLHEPPAWLVVAGDFGELFGSRADALDAARSIARVYGDPIREPRPLLEEGEEK